MKSYRILSALSLSLLLLGCASTNSIDTTNLNELQNLNNSQIRALQPHGGKIRLDALKQTALTLGAQGGLAWRTKQINGLLNEKQYSLNQIFNFNGLLLDHNIIPPVLEESINSLQLSDSNVVRLSDQTYKILQQARFTTTAPTWREYLFLNYNKPSIPDSTLLPKNVEERAIWARYVNLGWENGVKQANNIYTANLARLQRDYKGMLLYRKLLAQHIVSKPFVSKSNLGITSNKSRTEVHINDRILRITATPKLNPNSKHWQPVAITK